MRKFLKEFFYIPKHGKIHEKVMLTRVATTVTIVIMCLAAMSFTAYAYFSYNVTSNSNIIKAANFEAIVSITNSNNEPITVTKDGKIQTATLDADSYTVLLTKGECTAQTGFCIITIGDTDYYTQQIGVDVGRNLTDGSANVEFTLEVSTATKIEILSHWGTSSCYGYEDESNNSRYIESKDNIDLTASTMDNNKTPSTDGQDTTETTTTEPSTIPSATESTNPLTESSSPSEVTTPSETTETSEPTTTTEPTTTQPTESTQASGDETTEQSKPNEDASDIPTTEVSN